MGGTSILQAQGSNADSFVVFLAILLLVFPILFIRSLLKGWTPASTGGLFWKALLIFSSPFYVGIVVIQVLSATGVVSKEFGQMFPSLQNPTGKLPEIPEGTINFWSEFTVSLMTAALLSGFAAVIIYSIFKSQPSSRKKAGNLVFWAALYTSAIVIANGVFDRIQGPRLEAQAKKTVQQAETRKKEEQEGPAKARGVYGVVRDLTQTPVGDEKTFDEKFRKTKETSEKEMAELAKRVPDTVIDRFFKLASHQVKSLAEKDPLACYYFFHTGTYLRRFQDVFSEVGRSPEMELLLSNLERELRTPASNKVSPAMNPDEYAATQARLYDGVRGALAEDNQNFDVFDNPQKVVTPDQKTKGCVTYLAYIDQIAKLPTEDTLKFYRRALEERGEAINAVSLLNPSPALLNLYNQIVPQGGALAILFQDNPGLKRDFVFFLIENFEGDLEALKAKALERKKDLLDENLRYYFYLASNDALASHVTFHDTFLQSLGDQNQRLCGRLGGVLEVTPIQAVANTSYLSHEKALAPVMLSSRTRAREIPDILEGDDYDLALAQIEREMGRPLGAVRGDLDILLDEGERQTPAELLRACRQGQAFYETLSRWPRVRQAAFLRALLFEESPD